MSYSSGFKARMVQRMAGAEGISAFRLSEEVGVHQTKKALNASMSIIRGAELSH